MLAVREAVYLARRRDAILASNIRIGSLQDDRTGEVTITLPDIHERFVQLAVGDEGLEGIPELLERAKRDRRGVVVLADELGIITPARFWQSGMSIDLMWAVSQSRKLGADLIFTAQDVGQVDSFLRKLTQHVTKVRAIPAPSIDRRERGKRPWLFRTSMWLPGDADNFTPERRISAGWTRYRREAERWYSTDELVRPPSFLRGRTPRARSRDGAVRRTGTGGSSAGAALDGASTTPA